MQGFFEERGRVVWLPHNARIMGGGSAPDVGEKGKDLSLWPYGCGRLEGFSAWEPGPEGRSL